MLPNRRDEIWSLSLSKTEKSREIEREAKRRGENTESEFHLIRKFSSAAISAHRSYNDKPSQAHR